MADEQDTLMGSGGLGRCSCGELETCDVCLARARKHNNTRNEDGMNTPKTISIDNVDYVRADSVPRYTPAKGELPFGVGDKILIRTVTHYQLGRVLDIGGDFISLAEASWVADTGKFSTALSEGELSEVERCPGPWSVVGRGAIVDIYPWDHELPGETK